MSRLFTSVDNRPSLLPDHLPLLALFALIVREGSMSRAAARARLTRAGVSQRLRRLEEQLGMPLLRRTTRRLELTEGGSELLASTSRLLDDLERIDAVLGHRATAPPLRIAAPPLFVKRWLVPLLGEFVDEHPGPIELELANRSIDLLSARVDLVVRTTLQVPPGTVARRLTTNRLLVVAAPSYLERHGTPSRPHELIHHHCLRYGPADPRVEWRFRVGRSTTVVPIRPRWTCDDGEILIALAVAGRGIIVIPSLGIASELAAGALVSILEGYRRDEVGTWTILPAGRRAPARARALARFLAARLPAALQR